MSTLTLEHLQEMMRKFPPPPPDPFSLSAFYKPRYAGMDVIVEPDRPTIELSREVAELVGPEFAASVNAWLIARFGFREPVAKVPMILWGTKVIVNTRDYSRLLAICS
jgi:hypothetical protein